ncbi:MAG: hypothetical protein H7124_02405 [Phycisphaerales bacterium]|nr:hypothetical protein [Hyphomonadaceae bacterium]
MNGSKLAKLRREHATMRRSPQRARDLEGLAKRLGRKQVKRGKEPVWESEFFVELFPLSIPHHGGKDLKNPTKNQILDSLEDDLDAWDDWIRENDNGDEEN